MNFQGPNSSVPKGHLAPRPSALGLRYLQVNCLVPEGPNDTSPTLQRWVYTPALPQVPQGRLKSISKVEALNRFAIEFSDRMPRPN